MPSLRIDQSDLKCKNGCDYYGNPQWQGYCSKCHREQMQNKRRAGTTLGNNWLKVAKNREKWLELREAWVHPITEKASQSQSQQSSATLPRPDQKKPSGLKLGSHSSFSKFEEKRLRQSETLKKPNLLKFNVFKKSSTDDHHEAQEKKQPEFKVPGIVNEGMKREFRTRFASLPTVADRDCRVFAHSLITDVIKCCNVMTVDELSERVQRQYQRFMKHMDTSPHFSSVDSDTKELLMDFVEKHAMSYLHDLPSVVFSPFGTDDERLDRVMSERIQQLSWVGEKHLECKQLDKGESLCRQMLYKAISELLGMDSATSPGGKLARVRRCCRYVLILCKTCGTAPASADDLLPTLIFTVLKANPPRLVSNINFVTRFCNAQRLMTGEEGYYFTNLCCAVSFIENLTAESLNMDKKEFDCYMAMPATIGGSSWACALSLCGAVCEAEEQRALAEKLLQEANEVIANADKLASDALGFEEQITKKVQDVLAKTPLEILPRRELPPLGKFKNTTPLIDFDVTPEEQKPIEIPENPTQEPVVQIDQPQEEKQPLQDEKEEKLTILGFEEIEKPSTSKSPQHLEQSWELKQTNSMELLTPSPLGFTPFDSRSIDELMTPDDFGGENLAPGLNNINYDIDLSDFSGDNSIAEDAPKEPKDPFSPDALRKHFDPFAAQTTQDSFSRILEKFDEFSLVDSKNQSSDAFEVVHRDPFSPIKTVQDLQVNKTDPFQPLSNDPFSPIAHSSGIKAAVQANDPFSPDKPQDTFSKFDIQDSKQSGDHLTSSPKQENPSILDENDSPTAVTLLPSPLQPQTSKP